MTESSSGQGTKTGQFRMEFGTLRPIKTSNLQSFGCESKTCSMPIGTQSPSSAGITPDLPGVPMARRVLGGQALSAKPKISESLRAESWKSHFVTPLCCLRKLSMEHALADLGFDYRQNASGERRLVRPKKREGVSNQRL